MQNCKYFIVIKVFLNKIIFYHFLFKFKLWKLYKNMHHYNYYYTKLFPKFWRLACKERKEKEYTECPGTYLPRGHDPPLPPLLSRCSTEAR